MLPHVRLAGAIAIGLLLARPAAAAPLVPLPPQPAGVPWPTQQWATGPAPATAAAGLQRALAVVDAPAPLLGQPRAVVVIHHGVLVAERYMKGFSERTPLISWSVAKSFTHALLGIAV